MGAGRAQPAVRIARMLVDSACSSYGVEPNPLRALSLFQQAEIGLRIDIADGQTYYAKRMQEAIEGQAKARELIDDRGVDSYFERCDMGEYFMWANPKKKEWIEADVFSEFGFMLGTASELVARGITADPDGDIELHGAVDALLELLAEP